MDHNLLRALINNNIIRPGTELAILRVGIGLDGRRSAGNFFVIGTDEKPERINANHIVEVYACDADSDTIVIEAKSIVDGKGFRVEPVDIHLIDGMKPKNIAYVYGYNEDGTLRKRGKKRGRKPKIR